MSINAVPFPPTLVGPVYPITPQILVRDIWPGAQIQIVGSESGVLTDSKWTGSKFEACMPLKMTPKAHEYLVVTQTVVNAADREYSSTYSGEKALQVQGDPVPLPAPLLSAGLHVCSDHIDFSGLLPGATVFAEIESVGPVLEAKVLCSTSGSFPMTFNGPLPKGKRVTYWQEAMIKGKPVTSDKMQSAPIIDLNLSNPLPLTNFVFPPEQCTNHFVVGNVIAGGTFVAMAMDQTPSDLITASVQVTGNLILDGSFEHPLQLGTLKHWQQMVRCGLQSTMVETKVVAPAASKLDTPKRVVEICEDLGKVVLDNLRPNGATYLTVTRLVGAKDGRADNDEDDERLRIGVIPVTSVTQTIKFPSDWSMTDERGEVAFDFIQMDDGSCGAPSKSDRTGPQYVKTITGITPSKPVLDPYPLYECGDKIRARKLVRDAEIRLYRSDGLALTEGIVVDSDEHVYDWGRRLKRMPNPEGGFYGIQAMQTGCGVDGTQSPALYPEPWEKPEMDQPNIQPLRPGDQVLTVSNLIPGARVSVMVKGSLYFKDGPLRWAQEFTTLDKTLDIDLVSPLAEGLDVFAIQSLCSITSLDGESKTNPPVKTPVEKGTLTLTVTPSKIKKGEKVTIRVDAIDPETNLKNSPLFGTVTIPDVGSFPLGTDYTHEVDPASTLTELTGSISASSISKESSFSIPLTAADPPPDFILNIRLAFAAFTSPLQNTGGLVQHPFKAHTVKLTVRPSWTDSFPATFTYYEQDGILGPSWRARAVFRGLYPSASTSNPTISASGTFKIEEVGVGDVEHTFGMFTPQANYAVNPATNKGCFYWDMSFTEYPSCDLPSCPWFFKWSRDSSRGKFEFYDNGAGGYNVDGCLALN
ncbi:hypothetical protein P154DRAFT_539090 [Amniculicola lignicola CBS 123094]|uniref:Uncharacterized protein n=1 Tax=Amniculicola lignicola CBS 123094 TaxID=1392246 RepID=A0A6A5VZP2_9PLEO|nr:hypothetical protein P154DRAFT_539090 [Amniculicola lignicola CBS 123094]